MSDKYVIKNCPAIYSDEYCKENTYEDGSIYCQDCTDCLIKKIVELCKDTCLTEKHLIHKSSTFNLANRILKLLDIEECESENSQS